MQQDAPSTNWKAALYDGKHDFVSRYGEDIIPLLKPLPFEKILDLGCGTGDLSDKIAIEGATVLGIDSSATMIAQAKEKFPELSFEVQSGTTMTYANTFDAVFSNAVLHWIHDQDTLLANVYRSLKPGGRFVFEMGGKNNVQSITSALYNALMKRGFASNAETKLWYFPSLGEYASLLEQAGFTVAFAAYFKRPTELKSTDTGIKDWLKMFGNAFFAGLSVETIEEVLAEVQEEVQPKLFKDGKWLADYTRLRIVAYK